MDSLSGSERTSPLPLVQLSDTLKPTFKAYRQSRQIRRRIGIDEIIVVNKKEEKELFKRLTGLTKEVRFVKQLQWRNVYYALLLDFVLVALFQLWYTDSI